MIKKHMKKLLKRSKVFPRVAAWVLSYFHHRWLPYDPHLYRAGGDQIGGCFLTNPTLNENKKCPYLIVSAS